MKTSENDIDTPRPAPSHEAIASSAYELWRKKGSPAGCDEAIWLEAERILGASAPDTRRETDDPRPERRRPRSRTANRRAVPPDALRPEAGASRP
ncbi:MAG: DUF2934 domain-containing protein [Opitutaceae bacterium]